MNTVCSLGSTVRGFDIYHGDNISNIQATISAGFEFAYLKASEGINVTDPRFYSRWEAMKNDKILRGAYHFFHPAQDPLAQAKFFCSIVGVLGDGDLPCAMDWEVSDGVVSAKDQANGLVFLNEVMKRTEKTPVIYGSPYFLQALSLTPGFAKFPLWVAHYGVKCPLVPYPWTTWTFWQNSEAGAIPGIGSGDTDFFNGSMSDLLALAK